MTAEITERLTKIICERLSVQPHRVTPEASLVSDLGADSLDVVDLALAVEEAFALEIKDTDYGHLMCIADAAAYIEARMAQAREAAQ